MALCASLALAQAPAATPAAKSPAASADSRVQPTLGDDKAVIAASEKWLRLLDDGKLGAAWDLSAALLKSSVTRAKWISGIRDARKPFGKVQTRTADKFARAHQMPGAPDGDYVLVAFQTTFANGKRAEEQITWQLDEETWRVSGYYIR
ncbi:MAG TPA: DUF4019 domain-containing protein [Casimicrobiaceae bacterium]|jgi:hypothetical protein